MANTINGQNRVRVYVRTEDWMKYCRRVRNRVPVYGYHPLCDMVMVSRKVRRRIISGE